MIAKGIPQAHLTGECWTVQTQGLKACKTCEYRDTDNCGGQSIRITGKNSKGFTVPLAPGKTFTADELKTYLSGFTGTERYYKSWLGLLYTDGLQAMAEGAGAYWLIDAISSYAMQSGFKEKYKFQFWTLEVKDRAAVLTMHEDTGRPFIVRQEIKYTDFPTGTWEMYLIGGVLLLPSEY